MIRSHAVSVDLEKHHRADVSDFIVCFLQILKRLKKNRVRLAVLFQPISH